MDPMMVKEQHQEEQYSNSPWVGINDYHSPHTQSPAHEYNGYAFMPSSHGIPLEPDYNRPMPPMYSTHQPQQSLITAQWPSMLTNPSTTAPPPMAAPPPLAPVSSFASTHSLPPLTTPIPAPSSRRTLTDQDRRRMCQYHEENPTVKQTEIGAMFGVERSTVSKVLRQKDKYLFPDDGSRSPIKRSKGKFPDIERALSNWARNHQRQGLLLSDSIIRDKARFFATTVGNSESHLKVNSNSWLEKFKQKNHLLGAKSRKSSDANDSDNGFNAESVSGSQTPNGISPISPGTGFASPSPLSPSRSRDNVKTESPDSYMDFNYRHAHSQSATSLASCYSENTAPSPFSGGPQSPTSPFFSTDPNGGVSSYLPSQLPRFMTLASANTARPRSQTFPMLGIETSQGSPPGPGEFTPKQIQQIMSAPALETPIDEISEPQLGNGQMMHRHQVHPGSRVDTPNQTSSPTLMAPPPHPSTTSSSPNTSTMSSPISPPSQDEARRALELVMSFFQNQPTGIVDSQEFIIMGKLMEKLKIHGGIGELPGGMHSMLVGDKEMSRKRSIHSL